MPHPVSKRYTAGLFLSPKVVLTVWQHLLAMQGRIPVQGKTLCNVQDKKGKGRAMDWTAEVAHEERALEVLLGMTAKTLCRRSNAHQKSKQQVSKRNRCRPVLVGHKQHSQQPHRLLALPSKSPQHLQLSKQVLLKLTTRQAHLLLMQPGPQTKEAKT